MAPAAGVSLLQRDMQGKSCGLRDEENRTSRRLGLAGGQIAHLIVDHLGHVACERIGCTALSTPGRDSAYTNPMEPLLVLLGLTTLAGSGILVRM